MCVCISASIFLDVPQSKFCFISCCKFTEDTFFHLLYFANINLCFDICTKEEMWGRCVQRTPYYWCLFMCRARWSDLEKLLSHWTHLKGLRPVCLRWCRVNSSDLANLHSHPSQEQRYGFSPVTKWKIYVISIGIEIYIITK